MVLQIVELRGVEGIDVDTGIDGIVVGLAGHFVVTPAKIIAVVRCVLVIEKKVSAGLFDPDACALPG